MSLSSILFFAATELVLCLVPGPAVLLVISQAMKRGFRTSTRGAFGILAGNAIYFALSAAGLGALLMASRVVFEVIRYAGAGYLMLVGFRMIFFASSISAAPEAESRSFVQGLITQLANPKAIVFFTALLPQFVNPHGPLALQFLILGIVSIAIEFPVLAMYGFAADRGRALYGRHARALERAAGGCLVIAGAKLAAQ
jgi:threonine/homoserine/homoserine lactone efflux protein